MYKSGRILLLVSLIISIQVSTGQKLQERYSENSRVVPYQINYQGYITDSDTNPITDTLTMGFGIWGEVSGGKRLWTERPRDVEIIKGLFSVNLGENEPIPMQVFDGSVRYLEIVVDGDTLSPRKVLGSVGYSYRSQIADTAEYSVYVDSVSVPLELEGSVFDYMLYVMNAGDGDGIQVATSNYDAISIDSAGRIGITVRNTDLDGINLSTTGRYGVIVQQTNNDGIYIINSGGNGLLVEGSDHYGVKVNNSDSGGIYIRNSTSDGIRVKNANRGVEINNTAGDGIHLDTTGTYGIYMNDIGNTGMYINSTNSDGFRLNEATFDGVELHNCGDNGIEIYSPGDNGIYIDGSTNSGLRINSSNSYGIHINEADDNGILIDTSGADGFYLGGANNDGMEIHNCGNNGIEVHNTDADGIFMRQIGASGMYVGGTEGHGVKVSSIKWSGFYVDSAGSNGLYVREANRGINVTDADSVGMEVFGKVHGGIISNNEDSPTLILQYNYGNTALDCIAEFYAYGDLRYYFDGAGKAYSEDGWYTFAKNSRGEYESFATVESPNSEMMAHGRGELSGGSVRISFESSFSEFVSDDIPVEITLTPVGSYSGLYVEESDRSGFTVKSGAGDPNCEFNWVAIGRQKGREERAAVADIAEMERKNEKIKTNREKMLLKQKKEREENEKNIREKEMEERRHREMKEEEMDNEERNEEESRESMRYIGKN